MSILAILQILQCI